MVEKTLDTLKQDIQKAIAGGDDAAFNTLMKEYNSCKGEIAKAEAEGARKEAEALAGKREALANSIKTAVKALNLDAAIAGVKAKGFTYSTDHRTDDKGRIDANGAVKVTGGVGLSVPTIKARKAGGNGGGGGKSKDEYGMSLSEIWDKFKTSEDEAKMVEAEKKDAEASEKLGKSTNSNAWRVKNEVKKQAIADGTLPPAK
ncbi:hypothetical protein LCGC14_0393020 [marine sediment metagenome]|uniref:Uncharacterized protein n=1 Tax=marine sediment metagenome TaxID=412755 RepID=A0A0F9VL28_9ZZZZ